MYFGPTENCDELDNRDTSAMCLFKERVPLRWTWVGSIHGLGLGRTTDVKKRSNKNLKNVKNVKKRDKNIKKRL